MFLLTVQQNIQIFSFFSAIFRMLRFSKREKSTEKKNQRKMIKTKIKQTNKQTKKELKLPQLHERKTNKK